MSFSASVCSAFISGVTREIKYSRLEPRIFLPAVENMPRSHCRSDVSSGKESCAARPWSLTALNRAFGFGPDRLERFNIALDAELLRWAEVMAVAGKNDKESEVGYMRSKFDEALKTVCKQKFVYDFAERYKWIDDGVI